MGETETLNLQQRLLQVQKAVTSLTKDGTSKAEGNFPYVSSNMVLSTIRAAMDEAGVILITTVVKYAVKPHMTQGGKEHYFTELMLEFTWVNVDDPEQRETFRFPGQGIDPSEKGIGKAATYAEKYGLLKFFHIPTDADDPDAADTPANGNPAPAPAAAPAQSQAQGKAGAEPVCPDCGAPMVQRSGKKGPFWGCSTYGKSKCKGTLQIDDTAPAQPAAEAPADSPPPEAAAGQADIPQNPGELRQWMVDRLGIPDNLHQTTLDSLAGKTVDISKLSIGACTSAWLQLKATHDAPPEGADEESAADDNPFDDAPDVPELATYSQDNPPTLAKVKEFWASVTGLGPAKWGVIAELAGVDLTAELGPDECWALWEATWKLIRLDGEDRPEWVGAEEAA